ncbi:MAG: 30S ribosomal protein S12 methylthiotransferase RimO [bacterium]|nr:30S ribosomal protein S12 methylthiotransferase RimO [bacterium]
MSTVNLITLGCPKNTVDSERMHRLLELNGYALSDTPEEADVIIVNTCGFIEPAKEESIATALEAAEYKTTGPCKGVIVTGCLAERYRSELEAELTEADLIVGIADERDIVSHCDRLLGKTRLEVLRDTNARHLLTPQHWAYLRISDGCDRTCAFCAIPTFRGANQSEDLDRLVAEAYRMVGGGVKEIALIAQDTMRYGADRYGKPRLVDLIRELVAIQDLHWLRLHYAYPTGWRDDLIDLLATEEKLCSYVDMPIQHASNPILKTMNRGTTQSGIRTLIQKLRDRIPHLTIRSSVITGFPGEQEPHFQELVDFIDEIQFNRLVGFTYSHEEGTAAGNLKDDVPEEVKRERLNQLMALQGHISAELNATHIGKTFRVLIDDTSPDPAYDYIGRTRMDAPEIDGGVLVSGPATIGEFCEVNITDALEYDLIGQVVSTPALIDIAPPSKGLP